VRTSKIIQPSGWGLAALCALGLTLGIAPAARGASYSVKGAFAEGLPDIGLSVDQSTDSVYVANLGFGIKRYTSAGESPEQFLPSSFSHPDLGVAVDPLNRNVYVYKSVEFPVAQEIETYDFSGESKLGSFAVPGPGAKPFVAIASDSAGDVYYPDKEANTILKFSPAGTLEATIEGEAPVGAFKEPQGVALDASGDVYVADTGNGRLVRIEAGTGAQSVIDTGGTHDVAVDPVSADVFALDLNEEGSCEALPEPCYRVRAYHSGEATPFAEFGAGTINKSGEYPNHVAVDHNTGDVYVSDMGIEEHEKVWIFAPGTPPKVAYPTPSVTGLTASEVTLHGEVNPEGNETSCHFEYGTSEAYGTSVPCEPELVGEGKAFKAQAVTIKGLEGNTEYHFRLVATTAAGAVVHGLDQAFTALQSPPLLLTESVFPSDVTQNDVTFNATLNPQNLDTHYWFNYGTQPFNDAGSCVPSEATVPYATAPALPSEPKLLAASYLTSEELAGLPVSLDLATVNVTLHKGMESRALQPNTVYRFQVVAENAAGTSCEPEETFITLPPDPVASTGAASQVTQTTADVAGAVTPGSTGPNSDTTWSFQYGTDTSYTGGTVPTTSGDAGMGTSAVAVSTGLRGLAPNTTYHYRLAASNANDDPAADPAAAPQIADGADHTLTTLPSEPLAGQPSSLTETGVTLNGAVNPSGHELECRFEYGTSTAYEHSVLCQPEVVGEGDEYAPVSVILTRVTPGVTYHYRLAATGAGGDTYSSDAAFTLYPSAPPPGSNPFAAGAGSASVPAAFPLLSTPTFPPVPMETTTPPPKPLTNAQKLAKALTTCRKDKKKGKRTKCQREARKKYGTKAKAKTTAKRGNQS